MLTTENSTKIHRGIPHQNRIQLPKLWNLEVRFVVPILNSNGIVWVTNLRSMGIMEKSNMKMG